MKTIYQVGIILFVCLSLYIVRDDVVIVYDRVSTYLSPKIKGIVVATSSVKDNVVNLDKVQSLYKTVNTPGALKVTEGLVSNSSNVRLSAKDVIDWTNNNRALNGNLEPLTENAKLDNSAKIKVDDMFKQQYFEHESPDGVGVADLGDKVSYEYIVIGENLALGNFKDAQTLLDAWMASPGHRANILNTKYTEIGVAVGRGNFKGQDTWIAVQHFGLPRNACPAINDVLKNTIVIDQKNIKTMSDDMAIRKARIDSGVVYEGLTPNEQINQYNDLVATYNELILNVKQKISEYNSSIRAFNSCLSKNTSKV